MLKTEEMIREAIENALENAEVKILCPLQDGQHFEAVVVSSLFEGQPLVKQHQMVMESLKGLLQTAVHALSLKTYTPNQWATLEE